MELVEQFCHENGDRLARGLRSLVFGKDVSWKIINQTQVCGNDFVKAGKQALDSSSIVAILLFFLLDLIVVKIKNHRSRLKQVNILFATC